MSLFELPMEAGPSLVSRRPKTGGQMNITRNPSLRIRQAVRDNNVSLLVRLQHKVDLRNTDRNRLTSLSWAAIEGSLEVFEWLLLDYGHDDSELSRDADNNTILHLLASIPSPPTLSPHTHLRSTSSFPLRPSTRPISEQVSICLRMTHLYHTLFPFVLDWSNSGGKTALHVAAQAGNTQFINLLCDYGADVDLTDLQGNAPLHYASAWGHVDTIKVLLERGCQFATRNVDGFSAADFAFSYTVKAALETTARELFEERRNRRKAEIVTSASGSTTYMSPPMPGSRLRSGSVSTNLSTGSGQLPPLGSGSMLPRPIMPSPSATSITSSRANRRLSDSREGRLESPASLQAPTIRTQAFPSTSRQPTSSNGISQMHRRESEPATSRSQAIQGLFPNATPPVPPLPPISIAPAEPPSAPTSKGRPMALRSPSLPAPGSTMSIPTLLPPTPGLGLGSGPGPVSGSGPGPFPSSSTSPGPPLLGAPLPASPDASGRNDAINSTNLGDPGIEQAGGPAGGFKAGIPMRRANSAQTSSTLSSGAREEPRHPTPPKKSAPETVKRDRGTPI